MNFHFGSTETGWWVWCLRCVTGSNQVAMYGIAWGWDDDVPWSWLPSAHTEQKAEVDSEEIRFHGHFWLSWLGLTTGYLGKSKWHATTPEDKP